MCAYTLDIESRDIVRSVLLLLLENMESYTTYSIFMILFKDFLYLFSSSWKY